MKVLYVVFGLVLLILLCFSSCKTIISSNETIGIPPSVVIFTFDDGPNHRDNTTERLLDVLSRHQVRGVFCLLGVNVVNNPEIVRRIYNEGHIIVNHGYFDRFVYFMNDDEFRENLLLGERAITEALGFEFLPRLYRPHGGIYRPRQLRIIEEEGYVLVPFSIVVMDLFTTYRSKDRLVTRIIERVERQNGGIILLHDRRAGPERSTRRLERRPYGAYNRSWVPEAVETIIIALLDRGFIINETFDFNMEN